MSVVSLGVANQNAPAATRTTSPSPVAHLRRGCTLYGTGCYYWQRWSGYQVQYLMQLPTPILRGILQPAQLAYGAPTNASTNLLPQTPIRTLDEDTMPLLCSVRYSSLASAAFAVTLPPLRESSESWLVVAFVRSYTRPDGTALLHLQEDTGCRPFFQGVWTATAVRLRLSAEARPPRVSICEPSMHRARCGALEDLGLVDCFHATPVCNVHAALDI